jgi:pseudouridine-5'-phosphate glycosidase
MNSFQIRISDEVSAALSQHKPVVALESTIFSHLGLPSPANLEALTRCTAALRSHGVVPAITAVFDGVARVGIDESEWPLILGPAKKVGERELATAMATKWPVGATTVSSSLLLAARAGIRVFSTGGIGGVHRGAETSGDISSDLGAIAQHHVVTVCAGAKSFLDLPRTLEYLETLSVPVLGLGCDFFPEFTVERGDLKIPTRVETIKELAEIVRANDALGRNGGILACVPVPKKDGLLKSFMDEITATALKDANSQGITGAAVTPYVLKFIANATHDASVKANLSLAENNALTAAQLAVELSTTQ